MGTNDEFGPDTETIRAWLAKRATYTKDARVIGAPRGSAAGPTIRTTGVPERPSAVARRNALEGSTTGGPSSVDLGRDILAALHDDTAPKPAAPQRPGTERPGTERPGTERPGTERPGKEKPAKERSGRDTVGAKAPKEQDSPTPMTKGPQARRDAPRARAGSRTVRVTPEPPRPAAAPETVSRAPLPSTAHAPGQPRIVRGQWTEPAENLARQQRRVDFGEKGPVRRAMSLILLLVIAGAAATTWLAVERPSVATIGVAGTLGLLIIVVWAVRATCTTTRMSLERGRLTVVRRGVTHLIDVGSPYTPIAMLGEPEHRRWTVLLERVDQPLVVITRSMVDARRFTDELYRLRPELRDADDSSLYAG